MSAAYFMRIDAVVLGLAAVDSLHVQRVAEDEANLLARTQIGEPIPGEDTFHADDDIFPVGGDNCQQRFWRRGQVALHHDTTGLIQNAHIHGTCVQIDAAVILVLLGVEFHLRPPCWTW